MTVEAYIIQNINSNVWKSLPHVSVLASPNQLVLPHGELVLPRREVAN